MAWIGNMYCTQFANIVLICYMNFPFLNSAPETRFNFVNLSILFLIICVNFACMSLFIFKNRSVPPCLTLNLTFEMTLLSSVTHSAAMFICVGSQPLIDVHKSAQEKKRYIFLGKKVDWLPGFLKLIKNRGETEMCVCVKSNPFWTLWGF